MKHLTHNIWENTEFIQHMMTHFYVQHLHFVPDDLLIESKWLPIFLYLAGGQNNGLTYC